MESDEQKSDFDRIGSDVQKSEIDEMESVEQKSEVDTMGSDSQRSELNAMRSDEQKSEFYAMRSDDPKSELDKKALVEQISDFDNNGSDELKPEFDTDEYKSKFEKPKQSSRLQQKDMDKEKKPGTPTPSDVQSDYIELTWEPPKCLSQDEPVKEYEIRYKEGPNSEWRRYPEYPDRACVRINGLKSECSYKFIVRAVYGCSEGPYSPESIEITTKASLASTLLEFTVEMKEGGKGRHRLKSTEILNARNCEAKTRKFEVDLGKTTVKETVEKTILLVGETGSGKSTLVDGFINYFAGVNFEDPFRLTLVDLERDEKGKSQATSQTEWVTCYTIHPGPGSRIHYTLNIIDTPGFGDTRGLDKDKKLFDQLRQLFSSDGEKGVVFIDAVCLLMKAPDARLTTSSKYIYTSVLSLFGKDIKNNICALITFADGKKPKVLSAMEEAKLPIKSWYVFNNSGLFEDNKEDSFASIFWEIGQKSFQNFFKGLENMKTKSLKQTTEVLENRKQMEVTISNLEPLIDACLRKKEELRNEMQIIKEHETDIATNKNFEYTVDETHLEKSDLSNGKFATNCLNCKETCHRDCWYRPDVFNYFCSAMDFYGDCNQCNGKCPSSQHKNEPSRYIYKTKKVTKTYDNLLKKYEAARNKKLTQEQHIEEMEKDINEFDNKIFHLMEEVRKCHQVLSEIALQPNVISMKEYIDLKIQSEEMYKREGFQERITALRCHRKRVEIKDSSLNEGVVATRPVENPKTNKPKENPSHKLFFNFFFRDS